jgi:hypothetical protein
MERSVRWLDRCIARHNASGKQDRQNLFAIVQGGLDLELRDRCLTQMLERKDQVAGFAIGGLSGGEEKGWWLFDGLVDDLPVPQMYFGGCEQKHLISMKVQLRPSPVSANVPKNYRKIDLDTAWASASQRVMLTFESTLAG